MKTLKNLPIGNVYFSEIIDQDKIYVDKTDLIASIARADNIKAYFLGRPRRFGKTLLINTFEELFTNGLKRFKGLKIDTQHLWSDTNTYPVLHLDFSKFKEVKSIEQFNQKFLDNLLSFVESYHINGNFSSKDPITLSDEIFKQSGNRHLVLLVDEYDSALNASMLDEKLFESIRKVYSNFFSTVKSYEGKFRFIFITGITRYTHSSIFSPFNIFYDLTLDTRYQTLLGYTDEELLTYFGDYLEEASSKLNLSVNELHQKLREYYDGYHFNRDLKANLYCPYSILNFFNFPENGFANYWNESGAGTDVINRYFKKHPFSCSEILNGIEITANEYNQGSDISNSNHAVLLQQAGYYTFSEGSDEYDYVFRVPNKEVSNTIYPLVFENSSGLKSDNNNQIIRVARKISAHLFLGEEEEVSAYFNKILDFYGYDAFSSLMASEAILRDNLMFIFTIALNSKDVDKSYTVAREEINLKGRADLVIDLNKKRKVVLELKIAEDENSARVKLDDALVQVKSKDYGNNGFINSQDIRCYGVVFYKYDQANKKLGVLCKESV